MTYIVNPTCRLFWLPNSGKPEALAYFASDKKRVIYELTQKDISEVHALLSGKLEIPYSDAVLELVEAGVVEKSEYFSTFDFSSIRSRQVISYCSDVTFDDAIKIQEKLENMVFLIIGMGGVGCNVVCHLVGMGVRHFILIDPDVIEESNLNRQFLYSQEDIGSRKVDVAKRYILKRAGSLASVSTYFCGVEHLNEFECIVDKVSFSICSADSSPLELRTLIAETHYSRKKPYGFLGYFGNQARIGPLITQHNRGCGLCAAYAIDISQEMEIATGVTTPNIAPSSSLVNGLISSIFSQQIINWHSGQLQDNYTITYDLSTNKISQKDNSRMASCPVCGNIQIND